METRPNSGRSFDEDVAIELSFPVGCLIKPCDLPRVEDDTVEFIKDYGLYAILFGIDQSNHYEDYPDECRPHSYPSSPFGTEDPQDTFDDSINQMFAYSFFSSPEADIVKFSIPYIKQHTSVAFPSRLFFASIPNAVHYKIISKHLPDIVEGSILL